MDILTKYGLTQAEIDKFKKECLDDAYDCFNLEYKMERDYDFENATVKIFMTVDVYFDIYKTDDIYCNPDATEHELTDILIKYFTVYDENDNDCPDLREFLKPQFEAIFAV